jgi:hypothetical protein
MRVGGGPHYTRTDLTESLAGIAVAGAAPLGVSSGATMRVFAAGGVRGGFDGAPVGDDICPLRANHEAVSVVGRSKGAKQPSSISFRRAPPKAPWARPDRG